MPYSVGSFTICLLYLIYRATCLEWKSLRYQSLPIGLGSHHSLRTRKLHRFRKRLRFVANATKAVSDKACLATSVCCVYPQYVLAVSAEAYAVQPSQIVLQSLQRAGLGGFASSRFVVETWIGGVWGAHSADLLDLTQTASRNATMVTQILRGSARQACQLMYRSCGQY